jgi:hypothetical protein
LDTLFEVRANLDRTAEKRNQLYAKAHARKTLQGIHEGKKQTETPVPRC